MTRLGNEPIFSARKAFPGQENVRTCVSVAREALKHKPWRKWTVDKPAAFGDWLWDVFVVQLAAALDRVTLREVIAFIPVVILIFAYLHGIPIPPELMLVGDLVAYIDVFVVVFLLSMIGRVGVLLYVLKTTIAFAISCVGGALTGLQRLDFRHRRANSERHGRRGSDKAKQSDGDYPPVTAFALSPA
jgi:hypothetical protein